MRKFSIWVPALVLCVVASAGAQVNAADSTNSELSPMFGSNMVLQRGINAPLWGWTAPGQEVTVTLNSTSLSATADKNGKWTLKLPKMEAGGPYEITVSGRTNVKLTNVMFGDVWICSGQSNMEMGVGPSLNGPQEIAAANYPNIRLFTVPHNIQFKPQDRAGGQWDECNPANVARVGWGGFSAAGYFFGRHLHQELGVPIGLISTCWGGTLAEAWTSAEALAKMPDFRQAVAQVRSSADNLDKSMETYRVKLDAWYRWNDPGSKATPGWESRDLDESDWLPMNLPVAWENAGLPNYDGTAWFRYELVLTESQAQSEATIKLGPIDDADTTWVNGVEVGRTDVWSAGREYRVPAGTLKRGRNIVAVRVLDTGGAGGMYGTADQMFVQLSDGRTVSLAGAWKYRAGKDLTKASIVPMQLNENPNIVTVLYNGMIAPVVPYGIKGAIWYQGEANAGKAYQYRELLPTMIRDWRSRWGVGDFPFFIVSLANFTASPVQPIDDAWAELREAQAMTAQKLKNTGIAITIDIGDALDIHPKNKQDVGKRLALSALKIAYNKNIPSMGPTYKSMKVENGTVRVSFDGLFGGLKVQGDKLAGFAIAGADRKFVWADAVIDGETVVVSSTEVKNPVAVRYAWAANPVCNLYNGVGLPAAPFRTDSWPGITKPKK